QSSEFLVGRQLPELIVTKFSYLFFPQLLTPNSQFPSAPIPHLLISPSSSSPNSLFFPYAKTPQPKRLRG
ncbi:hypothetical protein, partial [Geitlerinema calcuttense]